MQEKRDVMESKVPVKILIDSSALQDIGRIPMIRHPSCPRKIT